MRILATVKIIMRDKPSNLAQVRPRMTSLSIGKSPNSEEGKVLLLQSLQNKNGIKYKIEDNVQQVFMRFINEGKVTIRFKIPAHDLVINGDTLEVKGFLRVMKNASDKNNSKLDTLVVRKSMNILPVGNVNLTFSGRGKFSRSTNLPLTCKSLSINDVLMKDFDMRIIRLKFLQFLDLSNNKLSKVPEDLSSLNLLELNLRGNHLGCLNNFSWLKLGNLRKSLKLLDISKNQLEYIPYEVTRFLKLTTLRIDDNYLTHLPSSIGWLTSLKYLSASNNQLTVLPSSFVFLHLTTLNICDNKFKIPSENKVVIQQNPPVSSLMDLASERVIKERSLVKSLCVEGSVPLEIMYYIHSALFCICRKPVFNRKCSFILPYSLRNVASEIFYDSHSDHLIATKFGVCSQNCHFKMNVLSGVQPIGNF